MADRTDATHTQRLLECWWLLELFSPQKVPPLLKRAYRPPERQVIDWRPGEPLPWQELPPPRGQGEEGRVWRHTVYLGVYTLQDTYELLGKIFGEDPQAHDQRPRGVSACAGLLVDNAGMLADEACVLSSAAWGVGQLRRANHSSTLPPLNGFPAAQQAFTRLLDEAEGRRRQEAKMDDALPQDAESVRGHLSLAQDIAGISGLQIATDRIVIESVAVARKTSEDAVESDFLNSLYFDDLNHVRAQSFNLGDALSRYLTPNSRLELDRRQDVIRRPELIDRGVSVHRLPKGRWLANAQHPLALSQQFSVNRALTELANEPGIIGVNGPPGTGKTTMLRDVLAGNVVERAQRLAQLKQPDDAFTDTIHKWTIGDFKRQVPQLRPEFTGFEMIVASANNAAVENVSLELPSRLAIGEPWREDADYFAHIASRVTRTDGPNADEQRSATSTSAWGLVAARLGNKRNRLAFRDAFWFDATQNAKDWSLLGMDSILRDWADGNRKRKPWEQARKDFNNAKARVATLMQHREAAEDRVSQLSLATTHLHEARGRLAYWQQHARACGQRADAYQHQLHVCAQALDQARDRHARHLAARPSWWEGLLSLGKATAHWRVELERLTKVVDDAQADYVQKLQCAENLRRSAQQAFQQVREAQSAASTQTLRLQRLHEMVAADRKIYGVAYPNSLEGAEREKRAPWLDAELDAARSDLFLAALYLHRDFLANCATRMRGWLRACLEVVAGVAPASVQANERLAAWQLFFLVVPMVSTTFASAGRMFAGLGKESLGWLFIDEAGQACPQYAVGSMWRAKRVIAVGDPLQLQPVVTIPHKAQAAIAHYCGVESVWLPPRASVQTLTDRVSTLGTELTQSGERVWVSAPLRVHRRCDDPMFSLCNDIAYQGIMVNGVYRKPFDPAHPDPFQRDEGLFIAPSHWVDEAATRPGTHLQPAQITRFEAALHYLQGRGIDFSDVIAVSPFRDVADRLTTLENHYPGLKAGTIHTAQGREAPVVILVLGGAPDRPGAKSWAASTVNLVNVAASRAQRRLYVIGDRAAWAEHNYFKQLSASLA